MSQNEKKQSQEQQCAAHAWSCIESCARLPEESRLDYTRAAKRLPVRIMASGLGQAVAFLYAKTKKKDSRESNDGRQKLIMDLQDWVVAKRLGRGKAGKDASLVQCIIQNEPLYMRRAANEALLWLQWLNRFAEGRFGVTDREEEQE